MGCASIYNTEQWDWICQRFMEDGYTVSQLAKFLDVNTKSIYPQLYQRHGKLGHKGQSKPIRTMDELQSRKAEFNALIRPEELKRYG